MLRCKTCGAMRSEAYLFVRCNDEGFATTPQISVFQQPFKVIYEI